MTLVTAIEQRPIWNSAVGRLVLASSQLESNVLQAIFHVSNREVAKLASTMGHDKRLSLLQALMANRDDETREGIVKIIAMLRAFNEKRNFVVHNSLVYMLGGDDEIVGAIVHTKNPDKKITLDEINLLADEAEGLSTGFWMGWIMAGGKLPGMQ